MTETPPPQQLPGQFEINLPPELEVGVFANFASIWQDNDGFILDFATTISPPQLVTDDQGAPHALVRSRVVSRVRIPPLQALELMRALTRQLDTWEQGHGPVAGPPPEHS